MARLFENFSPITAEDWKNQIIKDLKGAEYDELIHHSREGIDIQPFYFPTKDNFQPKFTHTDWGIAEQIVVEDPNKANKKALEILNKGVSHLIFRLELPLSKKETSILLEGIGLAYIRVDFKGPGLDQDFLNHFNGFIEDSKQDKDKIKGFFYFNPFNYLLQFGQYKYNEKTDFEHFYSAIATPSSAHQKWIVGGGKFHNAGATATQQLAFILAELSELIYSIKDNGLEVNATDIGFHLELGTHYFMEIAKFRALRSLVKEVFKAYGLEQTEIHIHAETDYRHLTVYDPEVNLLRTTTQAMSAVLGGCNSLRVRPFDAAYANANDFSSRLARNIQLILKGESYMDKVADPAAGSYFIETLTQGLQEKAWEIFQEIESKGGFMKAIQSGDLQQTISHSAQQEDQALQEGHKVLLGTNKFPKEGERMHEKIEKFIFSDNEMPNEIQPLRPYRLSEEMEKERLNKENAVES